MAIYIVRLAVDREARLTGRRITLKVPADNKLSAAIAAERICDDTLREPDVEYTHAVSVRKIPEPRPPAQAAVAVAA